MGYFANGTEGDAFRCEYCRTCVNNGDSKSDEGCAVWDLHLLFNSDQNKDGMVPLCDGVEVHGPTLAVVLGSLIVRKPGGGQECLMHRPREEPAMEVAGQGSFLETFDAIHGNPNA